MPRKLSTLTVGSVEAVSDITDSFPSSFVSDVPVIDLTHTNNCTLSKNGDTLESAAGNKFIIYFDIWQLMLYIAAMIVKPITAAVPKILRRRMPYFDETSVVLDLLCWMTILFTFFMGSITRRTKVTVLEPKHIAWNYISSIFFICDVLSSIPIQPLVCLCEVILGTSRLSIIGLFYLFCQLKFIRMISVIQYINSLSDYFRIKSKGKVFLLICIIMTTITVHGFALLQLLMPRLVRQYFAEVDDMSKMWFVKYKLHKTSFWNIYTNCVLKSSAFMLAIRNFYKFSNQEEDYLLAIVTYIVGKVMVCSTYVIVAVTVLNNRSMEIKFHSIINQLDEYMRQKQLPLSLRDRIKNYYNFKFQHKYFNSERIHDMLPDKLKKEINLHECKNLIQNVSLFAHLTEHQISTVVEMLTPEIFLPKDTIIQAGSLGDCMYFISSGIVAVYTHSGKEICHLEDGDFFGEISLVLQIPYRCATIVAIEITHVYMLKKKDFNVCLIKNPKIMRKVIKLAHQRFNEIREQEEKYKKMRFEKMHGFDDHLSSKL
nr:unnamed protein product [Callosobruchus chinensis]